jgi:hypothetical protein
VAARHGRPRRVAVASLKHRGGGADRGLVMPPSAPSPAPALDRPAPDARRRQALLVELGEADRDMWVRGGREALRRRAAALKAALAAGCPVQDVAEVLQVKPTDLQPWITPKTPTP